MDEVLELEEHPTDLLKQLSDIFDFYYYKAFLRSVNTPVCDGFDLLNGVFV